MTRRLLDERLGRWCFWTTFAGFNIAFLPMHWTGLAGMPRRIYTYPDGFGWGAVNLVTTIGAFVLALGILLLLVNVVVSRRRGAVAGPDPWGGPTLEWSVPSPPPSYDFEVIRLGPAGIRSGRNILTKHRAVHRWDAGCASPTARRC